MSYYALPDQTTVCRCGTTCKVREDYMQATRTEPMRFLGWSAYCPTCTVSLKVEAPQLVLDGVVYSGRACAV